jgi:rhamnosyltransferase subunit B
VRALVTTTGSLGNLYPQLAIALELKRRGHRVVFGTSMSHRRTVEAAGLPFGVVRPESGVHNYSALNLLRPGAGFDAFQEYIGLHIGAMYDDLVALSSDIDVIVSTPFGPAARILASNREIPFFEIWAAPPLTAAGPLPEHLRYLGGKDSPLEFTKRATAMLAAFCRSRQIDTSAARTRPLVDLYAFPKLLSGTLIEKPGRTKIVGACVFEETGSGLAPSLLEFLEKGEPPVVFTLGSTAVRAVSASFYETAQAVLNRLGLRGVFLTGSNNGPRSTDEAVYSCAYAPHAPLFARARVVVHHAGIGTLVHAMRAAIPSLSIPFAFDQPWTALLAERLGVARVLAPRDYCVENLAVELSALVQDERYRKRARALAPILASENGAKNSCDEIEKHVRA